MTSQATSTPVPASATIAPPAMTLMDACNALWAATLSLMTAFMHQQAPAHRYLLARRIAANFTTLREQECYAQATRDSFTRLAMRWAEKADRLSPHPVKPRGGFGLARPGWFSNLSSLF